MVNSDRDRLERGFKWSFGCFINERDCSIGHLCFSHMDIEWSLLCAFKTRCARLVRRSSLRRFLRDQGLQVQSSMLVPTHLHVGGLQKELCQARALREDIDGFDPDFNSRE